MPGSKKGEKKCKSSMQELHQQSVQCHKMFLCQSICLTHDDLNRDVNLKEDDENHSFVSYTKTR